MPDVWIGFNADDRRRYWWRNVIGTLAIVGVVVAMILTTREPGKWWWVGGFGVLVVVVFVSTVNLIYGRVLLTATGLEFRTFVGRRVIPWSEVAGIERRQRVRRSGIWCDLRVVRVRGRSLGIPGTVTNRMMDAELERKQTAIQECWSRAVGG
ncbi:PH domain-containing protein [Streptomyces pristinaespiralis]|uniref:PH domain-containing protein n=1 Tax=Streptomyces pristinaespiralis TaxID=38300 RepID=UPI0033D5271E